MAIANLFLTGCIAVKILSSSVHVSSYIRKDPSTLDLYYLIEL